jgi:hypothetical protein
MAVTALQNAMPQTTSGSRGLERLGHLGRLAGVDIETPLVADLSRDLHSLFDPVSDDALPIYFGPLLGRLYLEGL